MSAPPPLRTDPDGGPLVSVVIIAYNQEAYIGLAIESCIRQTYRNIEVIVADDASADRTISIANQFAERDSRVRVLGARKNGGITVNCQRALADVRGEFVALMGGDDVLYPEKISIHMAVMADRPDLALTFSQCHIILGLDPTPVRTTALRGRDRVGDAYDLARTFDVDMWGPAIVFRTSCVPRSGFHSFAPVASDWLFFVELVYGHRCELIEAPMAAYRMHAANIGKRRFAYLDDYVKSYRYIEREYQADERLTAAARKGLKRCLIGSFYAAYAEAIPEGMERVLAAYRSVFGWPGLYLAMVVAKIIPLSGVARRYKDRLKSII